LGGDFKHPSDEIEHFKEVPCTKEHDYELFYVGAMRKRSHPTLDAILDYVIDYCDPAFGHYIGNDVDDSNSTTTGWSQPRMPGDRARAPCNAPRTIRTTLSRKGRSGGAHR
jgi:hypothetical protein